MFCFFFCTTKRKEEETQKSIQANIDGTKKASAKEMLQNENLELFKLRLTKDYDALEKQCKTHQFIYLYVYLLDSPISSFST